MRSNCSDLADVPLPAFFMLSVSLHGSAGWPTNLSVSDESPCLPAKVSNHVTQCFLPSVLWHCWSGVRKSIWPVKIEWRGVGVVICLEWGEGCLHMVQLMPLLSQNPPHLNPDQFYPVPFWYQLTQVVLEKRPLDGFSAVVVTQKSKLQLAEMWSVQVRLHSDDISARQFVHNLKTVLFVWAYLSKAHLRTLIQKLSLKWTYLLTSFSVIHLVHAHQAVTYQ